VWDVKGYEVLACRHLYRSFCLRRFQTKMASLGGGYFCGCNVKSTERKHPWNAYKHMLGSPAISALMNRMSFSGKSMLFLLTRSSNISSDASSCFQCFPGLSCSVKKKANWNDVRNVTYSATGINRPSHTWEKGPCPRSWHSPASCTHSTSLSVIPSSGCLSLICCTMQRAK